MNYKETLFFIGKCLTITHEEHNKISIEKNLKTENIDWDSIVKVSTAHYVFSALYCNLKRAKFLNYLPNDLVEYMQYITDLNRERNVQIIAQAKEVNQLLISNNITPIFLKGTGNILEGLYEDIGERMVGDIDFIVNKNVLLKTVDILKKNGYSPIDKRKVEATFLGRHYPRMINKNRLSAIEIHHRMVVEKKYEKEFNLKSIETLNLDNFIFLSHKNQIILNGINAQINSDLYYLKQVVLRNSYDLFLLSHKENTFLAISKLSYKKMINPYFGISSQILNSDKISFNKNATGFKTEIDKYLKKINNPKNSELHTWIINKYLFIKWNFKIIRKSFYKKQYLRYSLNRIKLVISDFFNQPKPDS